MEAFLKENYGDKVRVYRASKREGLIRARLIAAKQATGDVIVVLDSHVEVNTNWLPPLIGATVMTRPATASRTHVNIDFLTASAPITANYRTVTCPCIDIINYDDFSLTPDHGGPGAFDWEFHFKTLPKSKEMLDNPAENYRCEANEIDGAYTMSRYVLRHAQESGDGGRSVRDQPQVVLGVGRLRPRTRHLGRRAIRAVLQSQYMRCFGYRIVFMV